MDAEQKTFLNFVNVSHETIHRLTLYGEMLIEWNEKFNLVAESTVPHIWSRHFLDSAQLMPLIPDSAKTVADMGAGAGFPGIVLAILAQDQGRALTIHAIESTRKKADFLQAVTDKLKLPVVIRNERIENIRDLKADVVAARALKSLPELLKYANYLKHKDTVCLFLKGKSATEELTEARKYWTFDLVQQPSCTDENGKILVLKQLMYKSRR